VPSGWAPYTTGSWTFDPAYGWTWVDTAPWGWAPYHHGRWVSVNGFWGWAPGPVVARLAEAVAGALAAKDVQESFSKQGATATPARPEELGRAIAAETARWAGVVKDAAIKAE